MERIDELNKYLLPFYFTSDYRLERARLESFINWPVEKYDAIELAKRGFYQSTFGEVRCYACKSHYDLQVEEESELPVEHEHDCAFLEGKVENFPAYTNLDDIDEVYSLRDMRFVRARRYSFTKPGSKWPWPERVEEMVSAGFYYTGLYDVTRCFCCRLELWQWRAEDVALQEHRKHLRSTICCHIEESETGRGLSIPASMHPRTAGPSPLDDRCGPGRFHPRITHFYAAPSSPSSSSPSPPSLVFRRICAGVTSSAFVRTAPTTHHQPRL